jgi:hypothetical protein
MTRQDSIVVPSVAACHFLVGMHALADFSLRSGRR